MPNEIEHSQKTLISRIRDRCTESIGGIIEATSNRLLMFSMGGAFVKQAAIIQEQSTEDITSKFTTNIGAKRYAKELAAEDGTEEALRPVLSQGVTYVLYLPTDADPTSKEEVKKQLTLIGKGSTEPSNGRWQPDELDEVVEPVERIETTTLDTPQAERGFIKVMSNAALLLDQREVLGIRFTGTVFKVSNPRTS